MMTLTQEEYLAQAGGVCPSCESPEIEGQSLDFISDSIYQQVLCLSCGALWSEGYNLSNYMLLSKKENDDEQITT